MDVPFYITIIFQINRSFQNFRIKEEVVIHSLKCNTFKMSFNAF